MNNSLKNIPGPPGWPFIGNLLDLRNGDYPLQALERLAASYGEMFTIFNQGRQRIFISSVRMLEELSDDERFQKMGGGPTRSLPRAGPPGLFSAPNESEEWDLAHRVLMPSFGPLAVEGLFDGMHDVAKQLTLKWARAGLDGPLCATDDFTRLTLDTIALCAMGYRFNSFYREDQHPFVRAMMANLAETSARATRPAFMTKLMNTDKQVVIDTEFQRSVGRDIVKKRRQQTVDGIGCHKDLLDHMINGKDPKSGQGMDDELINSNMNTFLVAGHETTSSLLSFAMYNLLSHPSAYIRAQREVDEVTGSSPLRLDHLKRLPYLNAVLRETLRLFPTAPAFTRVTKSQTKESEVSLCGYALPRDTPVTVLVGAVQRDSTVYGFDAGEFKPERMLEEKFKRLPNSAWKPFGTGVRACIGRAFAWQEALLALTMLLQRLDIRFDNPAYDLSLQVNLTMKPKDMYVRTKIRHDIDAIELENRLSGPPNETVVNGESKNPTAQSEERGGTEPISILFGSNTGTCEALAQRLATDVIKLGYSPSTQSLDGAAQGLPSDQPVVIVTSSYEGQPPDNARRFVEAISSWSTKECRGVRYSVFGCGHHDWASTFHRIPKFIDEKLAALGAERLAPLGLSDVAEGKIFDDFDEWKDDKLAIRLNHNATELIDTPSCEPCIELSTSEKPIARQHDTCEAEVTENTRLTEAGEPEKRHCSFKLPERLSYKAGDYLAVSPKNSSALVDRIMTHFGLQDGTAVKVEGGIASISTGRWLSVRDVLTEDVELEQQTALKDMWYLCEKATRPGEKAEIEDLIRLRADSKVPRKHITPFDLLCKYHSIDLNFQAFISMLPPLRQRLYSISSSPLSDPSIATATFNVHTKRFSFTDELLTNVGVCTSYLASLRPGDKVRATIKPGKPAFRLSSVQEQLSRPMVMIGAGAGLAPFRGFIQERYQQLQEQKGLRLSPAVLYFGCRSRNADRLYADELDQWSSAGAVDIKYAFSRQPEESNGCKYVQDRLIQDEKTVEELWRSGAKIFVCGSSKLAVEVKKALRGMIKNVLEDRGEAADDDVLRTRLESVTEDRFVADVFG